MYNLSAYTVELTGTCYEIGYKQGSIISEHTALKLAYTRTLEGFGPTEYEEAVRLFDESCPGISEEIAGFADALHIPAGQIAYYAVTYLRPRCSQIALLPAMTALNKPLPATMSFIISWRILCWPEPLSPANTRTWAQAR
ncbi:putative choloylglycine hydrolase [Paenibacillus sp. 598K]|uniref:hypothetical protein n=1 Tax=Paenibacillus sp. 598K TaxID=1117987 RepID=UPI000FF94AFC|nr:hypothetical protein [Paenibacillus sp. 598K]GBF74404.1 putative choloylglycine hydrolase [Paenibacillus sp. 598K]